MIFCDHMDFSRDHKIEKLPVIAATFCSCGVVWGDSGDRTAIERIKPRSRQAISPVGLDVDQTVIKRKG